MQTVVVLSTPAQFRSEVKRSTDHLCFKRVMELKCEHFASPKTSTFEVKLLNSLQKITCSPMNSLPAVFVSIRSSELGLGFTGATNRGERRLARQSLFGNDLLNC